MKSVAFVLFMACAACGESAGDVPKKARSQRVWFEEAAGEAGLDFVHASTPEPRFDFPEIMGAGVALFDFDADGDLDVYCVQGGDVRADAGGGPTNRLYANRGDGTFEDVTEAAGAGDAGYGMGCACGDYDNDGDVDLYVTNVGANVLFANRGDGTFEDVTSRAGVGDPRWGTSAAFFDYNGDGWLDLAVANYIAWTPAAELVCYAPNGARDYCPPSRYASPAHSVLFQNRGDGTFEDISERVGLTRAPGNGLGVATGDFDGDGRVDLFLANDLDPNRLWIRDAAGAWRDEAMLAGCAFTGTGFAGSGMGVHAFDRDDDGHLDLFVTQLRRQGHVLYGNVGERFEDVTSRVGIFTPSLPFTGFGAGFADFDNDGHADLFVTNGRVSIEEPIPDARDVYAEPDSLWEGRDGQFTSVAPGWLRPGSGSTRLGSGRGAAFGDLDNDGDVDVVVSNCDGSLHLLRNVVGQDASWIQMRVLDAHGKDAIGARVKIEVGGELQFRQVQSAYSYCSSNDLRVHFGLGAAAAAERVQVRWPDGSETDFGSLQAGQFHELRAP